MTRLYISNRRALTPLDELRWSGLMFLWVFAYLAAWLAFLHWFCGVPESVVQFLELPALAGLLIALALALRWLPAPRRTYFTALPVLLVAQALAQCAAVLWMPYLVALMSGGALGLCLYSCSGFLRGRACPSAYWLFSIDLFISGLLLVLIFYGLKTGARPWLSVTVHALLIFFLGLLGKALPNATAPIASERKKDDGDVQAQQLKFRAFTFFIVVILGVIYKGSYFYTDFFAHAQWAHVLSTVCLLVLLLNTLRHNKNWFVLSSIGPVFVLFWIMIMHFYEKLPLKGMLALPISNIVFVFFGLVWLNNNHQLSGRSHLPERAFIINLGTFTFSFLLGASFVNSWTMAHIQWSEFVFLVLVLLCIALVSWAALLPDLRQSFQVAPEAAQAPPIVRRYALPPPPIVEAHFHQAIDIVMEKKSERAALTVREKEVMDLLVAGKTRKTIAEELHISENTVKTHLRNIYGKFGVNTRAELLANIVEKH